MNKLIPIDSLEKEMCFLHLIKPLLISYDSMTTEARKLWDSLTDQDKIDSFIAAKKLIDLSTK